MDNEAFTSAILGMTDTLYRVAATQLRQRAVQEDAVQECLRRAITRMSGPVVVILGENGETLYEYCLYTEIDSMELLTGDRVQHNIVMPSEGLTEDKITIRLQSWRNHTIVFDEYTYTLE